MRPYDLVLFDWDGTLADSWPWFTRTLNDAAVRFGFRQVGADEGERLRSLAPRQILRELGLSLWKVPFFTRYMRRRMTEDVDAIRLFDDVPAMLARLSADGISIGIVTSNAETNVRTVLGETLVRGIDHFACDISMFGKASRIRKLVGAAGIDRARVILIGDEVRDIEAARSAGVTAGAVGWGYATADALRGGSPSVFFESMEDIARLLITAEPMSPADDDTSAPGSGNPAPSRAQA